MARFTRPLTFTDRLLVCLAVMPMLLAVLTSLSADAKDGNSQPPFCSHNVANSLQCPNATATAECKEYLAEERCKSAGFMNEVETGFFSCTPMNSYWASACIPDIDNVTKKHRTLKCYE